ALSTKRWGVYQHTVADRRHPLVRGVNTRFDVPHSRYNDVSRCALEDHGMKVLVPSQHDEVHLAVSEDGIRMVCFQGHPEYDAVTLLKEYRREVVRWHQGAAPEPPFPDHYLSARSRAVLTEYRSHLAAGNPAFALEQFPETLILPWLHNSWHDTAEAIMDNWVGLVYRLTHVDRRRPFAPTIDPQDPLGWRER
ncbi:MAG: homoserine O-succinyltransferase, partial [Pseudomonadota bacterium]